MPVPELVVVWQVEAKMQELKAKGQSPFTIDKAWLAEHRPGLLLTQDACAACDVDSSAVAQVLPSSPCCDLHVGHGWFLSVNAETLWL